MGRFSSIDMVPDCMGIIRPIHLYGKRYRRIFLTIDYEGVIVISIRVLRREIARAPGPITFQYRMDIRLIGFSYLVFMIMGTKITKGADR